MGYQDQPSVMDVEKNYGLKVLSWNAQKKGWMLETNKGRLYLQYVEENEASLLFQYSIYQHMKSQNFDHLLHIYFTKDNKPYLRFNHRFLQAYEWKALDKVKFKNPVDLHQIVQLMAKFHQASAGFKIIPGSKAKTEWGRWIWVFRSYCMLALKLKEIVMEKRDKEKVEKKFLEKFDEYYSLGLDCIQRLQETAYLDIVRESMHKNELCIHNVDEKNFAKDEHHHYYIISLEDVKHDIRAIDVANLILQNIEDIERIKMILKEYNAYMSLTADELEIIKAYVEFPHAYFKVIEKYYKRRKEGSKKDWNKKMKKAIEKEKRKKDFMQLVLQKVVNNDDRELGNE